ncbi:D-glycero-beta-D-manno-heptose 1-phosphate adenylyltransferase [Rhodophyticola sp. CCM32]|uniref:D-glycero-beta-D-manno-heptose 1-phosphate adenylyltransferase n=1 Tax=Rhodophyticola sp. CCM32 TaxID=2916397 RepID=UPI00107FC66C|nr:D-glycero-beta-D-manno-heptose 1-phosphate adenylyltransferase [Rhodophyticola sp. CCM32]QBY00378.1 D-glycero-beta-D-manno-heptose 1-phosphate adenylyltransferase [Rhodophyticola sp. CCM32]
MSDLSSQCRILRSVIEARAAGERIVFTNGCFDLLHPGHIRGLQQARSFGDRLIVGLNSDASVARLKGPSRPILPFVARAEMLQALSCVDWVVGFGLQEDDSPAELIAYLNPDVLAKGGDYTLDQIVGADTVLARGGRIELLDFHAGWSSSGLVAKIRRDKK